MLPRAAAQLSVVKIGYCSLAVVRDTDSVRLHSGTGWRIEVYVKVSIVGLQSYIRPVVSHPVDP